MSRTFISQHPFFPPLLFLLLLLSHRSLLITVMVPESGNSVSSSLQISAPFTCTAFTGTDTGNRQLKLVNFEAHDNHAAHDTEGLSKQHLVVRRGRPFKIQLLFGQGWNPHAQILVLEVWLGIKNKMSHSYK